MSKKVAILQSNYIPWKGYFDLINMVDEFIIYDSVQYTKNDWRNRNLIKTSTGLKWLTIPVKHKFLGQKINETEIADNRWKKKHWETLRINYGKAQYFSMYAPLFEDIYLKLSVEKLSDINRIFIDLICRILEIETKIIDDRVFSKTSKDPTERLVEILKQCHAKVYLSGPSAKDYLNERLFADDQITIDWMDYSGYKEYRQLHLPFKHQVSILDLIFNEGPASVKYLKSFKCK